MNKKEIFNIPNMITMARIVLTIPVIVYLSINGINTPWLALPITLIGTTDWVDGTIARKFNMQTKLGQLLDPIADKIFNWGIGIVLLATGVLPAWVLTIAARDLTVAGFTKYMHEHGVDMPPTMPAKIKMCLQSAGLVATFVTGFGMDSIVSSIAPMLMISAIATIPFEFQAIRKKYWEPYQEQIEQKQIEQELASHYVSHRQITKTHSRELHNTNHQNVQSNKLQRVRKRF